jgi:hypothetical protein
MLIYLGIKKYKATNSIVYYQVITSDFPEVNDFFIGVDKEQSKILFFKSESFDAAPDYILDLNDMDREINIEWLSPRIIHHIWSRVSKALHQKTLPDDISYCA